MLLDKLKGYLPYLLGFMLFAAFVFSPELSGKKLGSHDSVSLYTATKEWKDYFEKGEDIKWTNRIFAGQPLLYMHGDYGNFYFNKIMKISEFIPPMIFQYFIIIFSYY